MRAAGTLLAAALSAAASPAAELPDTVERVRTAVVGVGTFLPTRQPPASFRGTGFAVADGRHVLTNAHVVAGPVDVEKGEALAVFVGRGPSGRALRVRKVAEDALHDLALLRIEEGTTRLPALTLGGSRPVREGAEYAFTGFPIGTILGLYPATHRGIVSAVTPVVIPAGRARELDPVLIRRLQRPYEVYQLDATAYPGNSGSPLYEPDTGRVVGIVNKVFVQGTKEAALERPSGISYAVPIEHAVALLRRAGLR
ncbi:S1 family peptidase [Inmirania thermothiophila]|uniref:Trypsin-like peptidase n=1 Tax=Inmirania thermothiophila TaxID=1750597 RepID=A0A3N1XSN1_9GAMM|nr:serine protease [Inmirania thermothiophila]ROR29653.1 trypsin-like peptidase [Inmirania thermothiophila]